MEKHPFTIAQREHFGDARTLFWSGLALLLRRSKDLGQFAEVLSGCGRQEFVICTVWARSSEWAK
jgi:hypothetical protein